MSELKTKGTITKILPVESGKTKDGKEWSKLTFVLDTKAQYNPLIAFTVFGAEKIENFNKDNKEGQEVEVSFNVSSREYEGKWYNSIDAWKVFAVTAESVPAGLNESDSGDLPF
jgi:hypothetical protein